MNRNFEIVEGIYIYQDRYKLDLHNNFDFKNLNYSIEKRKLLLNWERTIGDWVSSDTPKALSIEFFEVSEFRFMPRDSEMPFTEDDCINSIGYLVDEDWAEGITLAESVQKVQPHWLTAIDFMSGAVLAVQAKSAKANVMA